VPLQIVLASQSPQRSGLLSRLGLNVLVQPSDVDEAFIAVPADPLEQVYLLAQAKAAAVARHFPQHIVLAPIRLLSLKEASSANRAARRWRQRCCAGCPADAIWYTPGWPWFCRKSAAPPIQSRTLTAIVSSTVTFHQLDDEQIAAYVQTGEPLNKAGAYGLQGSGSQLVASLSGCFTNVVGLSLCAIAKLLTAATGQPVLSPVALAAKDASTPIEPGKADVTADVTVSFTIR